MSGALKLLAFPELVQRLAGLALLRQDPGVGREGSKQIADIPRPERRDRALDQWLRPFPVAPLEVQRARNPYTRPTVFASWVASASSIDSAPY